MSGKSTQTADRWFVRIVRTPSTSPPPGPPDEEYMREGYDHDDIYIMVEDEFHCTAQAFTKHLHHAEYQRRKKRAREAAPPSFEPTANMRAELRKKLEASKLRVRQKDALGKVTNGVGFMVDDDEEQEEDDDPWLGTSLAGLMTDGQDQKRTALVGLEKIQSSTRAAMGLGRGVRFGLNKEERKGPSDILRPSINGRHDGVDEGNSAKPEAMSKPPSHVTDNTSPPHRARSRFGEPSIATRKLLEKFDDVESMSNPRGRAAISNAPPSQKGQKAGSARNRDMQLSDVPTFLV